MANEEHLEILRKGVDEWDRWREGEWNREMMEARRDLEAGKDALSVARSRKQAYPDLSDADLSGADLSGADLSRADLSRADLSGADLSHADLTGANLSSAKLIGADLNDAKLENADLTGADLSSADLSGTDLSGADLSGGDLRKAVLRQAQLRNADLCKANLGQADLSEADITDTNLTDANLRDVTFNPFDFENIPANLSKRWGHTWTIVLSEGHTLPKLAAPQSDILRSIEFGPEYHEAGTAILSYLGTVLRNKYRDTPVGVTIKQEGLKVTMAIETPEGKREEIERTLEEYGLVVQGEMSIEDFLSDPLQRV